MFNLFKKQQQRLQLATLGLVQDNVISCWTKCVNEEAALSPNSIRLGFTRWGWENVTQRFLKEKYIQQFSKDAAVSEERFAAYLAFVDERILQQGYRFGAEELERIGEFIAVASVLGLEESILSNPERAAIIFDLLPASWLNFIKMDADRFNELYSKHTGRKRVPRR